MTSKLTFSLCLIVFAAPAFAQTPPPPIEPPLPPSLLLPNYNRVLIGEREALEGGAFTARAEGPVATFYNPAGLALAKAAKVTAGLSTQEWSQYSVGAGAFTTARTSNRSIGGVFGVVTGPGLGIDKWRFGLLVMRPVSIQPAMELRVNNGAGIQAQTVTYVTTSSLSDFAPTLAAAYEWSPKLRLGVSAGASAMSLDQNQALFIDGRTETALRTIDSTLFSDGIVWSAVFTGGVQWDIAPGWRAGAKVTLPSIRVFGNSSMIYRGTDMAAAQGLVKSFADDEVELHYRQPFTVSAGLSYVFERGSLEFDVRQYAGTGPYDVFRSDELVQLTIATPSAGVTTDSQPFPVVSYQARPVTNVAVGGNFKFSNALTVHGGAYTDRSPVPEGGVSPVFARMNLTGFTAGASVQILRVVGSAGIAYAWGRHSMAVDTPTGPVQATVGLKSLQVFYAFSVSF
jgi:long-subunit fatty acid transport protein